MNMFKTIFEWIVPTAHAQLSTSTVGTLVDDTISAGGTILQDNLLSIFGIGLALAFAIFVYRVIKGMLKRPR